ncbi:hypothetical protein CENSYa_0756 [Cenarchaeum symbiosum A]|uniref:Uncharacterized protein n=1 Tax=Cenarchaeum symbiosum (strain A) TaxID=414004 RepID=A0RVM2_CENSY|nr:hypothetical protein CENSYa_0756 [Cenarchaeum symbiosum A]
MDAPVRGRVQIMRGPAFCGHRQDAKGDNRGCVPPVPKSRAEYTGELVYHVAARKVHDRGAPPPHRPGEVLRAVAAPRGEEMIRAAPPGSGAVYLRAMYGESDETARCRLCGEKFEPRTGGQKWCSARCRNNRPRRRTWTNARQPGPRCRGACAEYASWRRNYARGAVHCIHCREWLEWNGSRCPCCRHRVRRGPARGAPSG